MTKPANNQPCVFLDLSGHPDRFAIREAFCLQHSISLDPVFTLRFQTPVLLKAETLLNSLAQLHWFDEVYPGVISEISLDKTVQTTQHYTLTLHTPLVLANQTPCFRVFVGKSLKTIAKTLMQQVFPLLTPHWHFTAPTIPQCIQDQETDLAFFHRLLSQHKAFYYIEGNTLHIVQDAAVHKTPLPLTLCEASNLVNPALCAWEKRDLKRYQDTALTEVKTHCPALQPGKTIKIGDHCYWVNTLRQVLTDFNHYRNTVSLISFDTPYCVTPLVKPHRSILYPAIIDAPSRHEKTKPYLDKKGCYRVRFTEDCLKKPAGLNSIATPLLQPFGDPDPQKGLHFPVLPGTNVGIQFIDHDDSKPIIVTVMTPPRDHSDNQTAWETPQTQRFCLEDTHDTAAITLNSVAQKSTVTLSEKTGIQCRAEKSITATATDNSQLLSDGALQAHSQTSLDVNAGKSLTVSSLKTGISLATKHTLSFNTQKTLQLQAKHVQLVANSLQWHCGNELQWFAEDTLTVHAKHVHFTHLDKAVLCAEQALHLNGGGASLSFHPNQLCFQGSHLSLNAPLILLPNKTWLGEI